jgi:signal transduction histidine kinase
MPESSPQVPSHRGFPEVSSALRAARERIIADFVESLPRQVPEARGLAEGQIRDDLPRLLDMMADALKSGTPGDIRRLLKQSPDHGGVRFRQQFDLRSLIDEYILLRPIVTRGVVHELSRDLKLEELIALGQAIDGMIGTAVLDYAEAQEESLRSEASAMAKYLSFLSHDLRGGLNGVMLMIEVLKRDLAGEERLAPLLEDLDSMRRGVLDTVATMDRFLSAERMRRGKMPVKVEQVHLERLIKDLTRGLAYQLREHQAELKVVVAPGALVQSDPDLIGMVLQNLLGNAMKYGRGSIEVNVAPRQGGWRISVIDAGPGIPRSRLDELFRPFSRGETYGQQGIGLGLYIARHAAHLLNARLWAESEVGVGSKFHLDL